MDLLISKEPLFASSEKRRGRLIIYMDKDGAPACCNFKPTNNARLCSICGNACVQFIVDDHGEYTCSACGKFPQELLLS